MSQDTQNKDDNANAEKIKRLQNVIGNDQNKQPLKAAVGAFAGSIATLGVSLLAFGSKFWGEMSRVANRNGISMLEIGENRAMAENLGAAVMTDAAAVGRLKPYFQAAVAAPFVGAAAGAWIAATRSNKKIHFKQDAIEALRAKPLDKAWQDKLDEEKAAAKETSL